MSESDFSTAREKQSETVRFHSPNTLCKWRHHPHWLIEVEVLEMNQRQRMGGRRKADLGHQQKWFGHNQQSLNRLGKSF